MRLIFVNRFYWPEMPVTGQLLTDLAELRAKGGDDVTVITSHSGHASLPAREVRGGVQIHRVRSTRWMKASIATKAVDIATFYLGALWRLFRAARPGTTVVAMTDPPLFGIGAWLVARLRGAILVHWVQDIYPELAIELAGQGWLRIVRPLRDLSWRRADACVTLGTDMAALLAASGVAADQLFLIPNWAPVGFKAAEPEAAVALRRSWGLAGKFVVGYSGNLGRVHDLEPILEIADALRDDPTIAFAFVGGGPRRGALESDVARRGLKNVSFFPAQPRDRFAATLAAADLHLVTLLPGCERLVFPSKLYGIVAVGHPVLFIGPAGCELAQMTIREGFGIAHQRDDIPGIVASIHRLAANPVACEQHAAAARRFAAESDFTVAASRWNKLLGALHACRPMAEPDTKVTAR